MVLWWYTSSLPFSQRLTACRCLTCSWSPGLGKSWMRNKKQAEMRLLSSRSNPVLTKVSGKIPIDFQVRGFQSWPGPSPQEGTCNSLAAQTTWARFSRETLVFRLSLCVSSHAACTYPTVYGVVGDAEAIQVFVEVCRGSTELKRELNWLCEKQGYSELVPKCTLSCVSLV